MNKIAFLIVLISMALFSCNGQENKKEIPAQEKTTSLKSLSNQIIANPDNAELLVKRAKMYQELNQTNKAIVDIQSALNLDSDNSEYYLLLTDYYMQLGQLKNAISVLKTVLSIDPENIDALLKMGEINLMIRKYEDVFQYANSALKVDQYNSKAFFLRAYTYKEMGDTLRAIENFRETINYDPNNYNAYVELGVLFSARNEAICIDYFKNAIALDSANEIAYYNLGMYYQNNDYLNEALDIYRTIIKNSPEFQYSYYNVGFIYLELLKVPDEAIPYFNQAILVDPNYYEAYFNRGLCYEILGDVYRAQDDYNMALKINPKYSKASEGLVRVHEIMSR